LVEKLEASTKDGISKKTSEKPQDERKAFENPQLYLRVKESERYSTEKKGWQKETSGAPKEEGKEGHIS